MKKKYSKYRIVNTELNDSFKQALHEFRHGCQHNFLFVKAVVDCHHFGFTFDDFESVNQHIQRLNKTFCRDAYNEEYVRGIVLHAIAQSGYYKAILGKDNKFIAMHKVSKYIQSYNGKYLDPNKMLRKLDISDELILENKDIIFNYIEYLNENNRLTGFKNDLEGLPDDVLLGMMLSDDDFGLFRRG